MRAGVDRQLRAGTDGAGLALHQDLIRGRRWQIDLAHFHLKRFDDDGLACFHIVPRWRRLAGSRRRPRRHPRLPATICGFPPRYNRGMAGELQSVAPESTPESGNRLTRFLALNRTVGIVLITVLLFGLGEELWRPFLPVQFNAQTKEIAG